MDKKLLSKIIIIVLVIVGVILGHIDIMIKTKKYDIPTIGKILQSRTMIVFGSIFGIFLPLSVLVLSYINKIYYDIPPIVLINVGFIALIISLVFFFIIAKEENVILEKQIKFLFEDLFKDFLPFISKDKLESIKTYIKDAELPNLSKEDKQVAASNKKLRDKSIFVLGMIGVIGFGLSFILAVAQYNNNVSIKERIIKWMTHLLPESLILLLIVFLTYIIFLFIIPVNYKSLDPNEIKYFVVDFLEKRTKYYKTNLIEDYKNKIIADNINANKKEIKIDLQKNSKLAAQPPVAQPPIKT